MIAEAQRDWYQFVSNRYINDINRKLPYPDNTKFMSLVQLFYEKKISNVQFKQAVKELQNDNNFNK